MRDLQTIGIAFFLLSVGPVAYATGGPPLIELNKVQAAALGFTVTSGGGTPSERVYVVAYPPIIGGEYEARSTIVRYWLKNGGSLVTRTDFRGPPKSPEVVIGSESPAPEYQPSLAVFYKCIKDSCSKGPGLQYVLLHLQTLVEK